MQLGTNNAVYFEYALAGVTVNISQASESFLQFMIGLCTSIGGVFAVGGVLTALLKKSMNMIFKENIGVLD